VDFEIEPKDARFENLHKTATSWVIHCGLDSPDPFRAGLSLAPETEHPSDECFYTLLFIVPVPNMRSFHRDLIRWRKCEADGFSMSWITDGIEWW
jgi:hypothetical protein